MQTKDLCVYPGTFLIPAQPANLNAWACVACDQFTSQPEYWEEVKLLVGNQPSTYHLIVPECWLNDAARLTPGIHQTMRSYLSDGVLESAVTNGFILTERATGSGARLGLVVTVDLECYNYQPGALSLIRATEETIEARIPARLAVRRGAALETSHVMLLMDDPMHSVVEPLYEKADKLRKLYDFPLMMGGGHASGFAVESPDDIAAVYDALEKLRLRQTDEHPLLFAVGDGNHSLAAAKAAWEEIKRTLTPSQTASHPARFAMVEIENIHDDALHFQPIHRLLTGMDGDDLLDEFAAYAASRGMTLAAGEGAQSVVVMYEGKAVTLSIANSPFAMAASTLQCLIDDCLAKHPEAGVDYIHGEETLHGLTMGEKTVAFVMPGLDKNSFFETIRREGRLARKTFSLGEAAEKRYYMECRAL